MAENRIPLSERVRLRRRFPTIPFATFRDIVELADVGEMETLLEILGDEEHRARENEDARHKRVKRRLRRVFGGEHTERLSAENQKDRLPKSFTWPNDKGEVTYTVAFLQAFSELTPVEQGQVIEQLKNLATHGPEYHALHTRKRRIQIPSTPSPCLASRGADHLRFSWKKNDALVIYWLWRKGDSRVRESEA